jgi:NAD(P)-dependent dehydrogenase (short-subunit alcohol dehydrogenase family)
MNVVITGASRGIGLELTRQALQRGDQVMAVARQPERSKPLQDLRRSHQRQLEIFTADLSYPESPGKILLGTERWMGHVDVLINNAGILKQGEVMRDFVESFQINAVMPFMVTRALVPLLKKSQAPRVVNITSKMGSIADNASGGYYAYRASKAALNMINKSISIDNPWLTSVVVHPGWVKTDMGGSGATLSVTESAQGIWALALELQPKQTGHFYDYQSKEIPW